MAKNWYLSKTLWVAVLMGIAGILTALSTGNPELQTVGWLMIIKSGIDGFLRLITTMEIK